MPLGERAIRNYTSIFAFSIEQFTFFLLNALSEDRTLGGSNKLAVPKRKKEIL